MNRFLMFYLVIFLGLAACTTSQRGFAPTPIFDVNATQPSTNVTFKSFYTNPFEIAAPYQNDVTQYLNSHSKSSPTEQSAAIKDIRNKYLNNVLSLENVFYSDFQNSIRNNTELRKSIVGLISIGLSSAATLITGPTAQALSATDTALKAANQQIDTNALADQTIEALLNAMDGERAPLKKNILLNMAARDDYTLEDGLRDIQEMQRNSDLLSAIKYLSTMAAVNKSTNESDLLNSLHPSNVSTLQAEVAKNQAATRTEKAKQP